VAEVIDQLVILDSGSTDCTLDIARKFGAEIHHTNRADNYAENYNHLFSLAKYDYILFLHSDEFVCDGSRDLLKTHVMAGNIPRHSVFFFKRKDIDRFKTYSFMGREILMYRLLHKNAGFWKFPVHEYFFTTGVPVNSNIIVYHDHQRDSLTEEKKRRKYKDILDNFFASNPQLSHDEACRLYMLKASDHLALKEFSKAMDHFDEAIRFGHQAREESTQIWLRRSHVGKALVYYMTERLDEAARTLFMTDDFPDTILEKYYFLAKIAQTLGKPEEAFNYFRIALNNRGYSDACFFSTPFRIVFNLLDDAVDAASALDYSDKSNEIRNQFERGFGNILPYRDELRLFP